MPYALGVAALAFAALFAIQLLLRREVEEDPDEQEAIRRATTLVAITGDEVARSNGVESELVRRSQALQDAEPTKPRG